MTTAKPVEIPRCRYCASEGQYKPMRILENGSSDLCVLRAHRVPEWREIFVSMASVRENAFLVEPAFHTAVSFCPVLDVLS
jgi:hypothetical protein